MILIWVRLSSIASNKLLAKDFIRVLAYMLPKTPTRNNYLTISILIINQKIPKGNIHSIQLNYLRKFLNIL